MISRNLTSEELHSIFNSRWTHGPVTISYSEGLEITKEKIQPIVQAALQFQLWRQPYLDATDTLNPKIPSGHNRRHIIEMYMESSQRYNALWPEYGIRAEVIL